MWYSVPAIKQGRTKKLTSLRHDTYTILDKIGKVNYRMQLTGYAKTQVLAEICYTEPTVRDSMNNKMESVSTSQKKRLMALASPLNRHLRS